MTQERINYNFCHCNSSQVWSHGSEEFSKKVENLKEIKRELFQLEEDVETHFEELNCLIGDTQICMSDDTPQNNYERDLDRFFAMPLEDIIFHADSLVENQKWIKEFDVESGLNKLYKSWVTIDD